MGSKFQGSQDYRIKFTGVVAELYLMLFFSVFTVFSVYCGETGFDGLHSDSQYTQRIKTMTSSEIVYPLGIEEKGSFEYWLLPTCVYSHGITMLIGIYVVLDFKFIFNRLIFNSEHLTYIVFIFSIYIQSVGCGGMCL